MDMNILLNSVASTIFSGAGTTMAYILASKIARLGNIITPLGQKSFIYSEHICLPEKYSISHCLAYAGITFL